MHLWGIGLRPRLDTEARGVNAKFQKHSPQGRDQRSRLQSQGCSRVATRRLVAGGSTPTLGPSRGCGSGSRGPKPSREHGEPRPQRRPTHPCRHSQHRKAVEGPHQSFSRTRVMVSSKRWANACRVTAPSPIAASGSMPHFGRKTETLPNRWHPRINQPSFQPDLVSFHGAEGTPRPTHRGDGDPPPCIRPSPMTAWARPPSARTSPASIFPARQGCAARAARSHPLVISSLIVLDLAKFVHGPEGQRKLAGGEASPRARTTGLRPPQRMRPGGCAGRCRHALRRTLRGASGLYACSCGSLRSSLHHRLISTIPSGRQTSPQHIRSHPKTNFAKSWGSQEFTFLDSLSDSLILKA